MSWCGGGEISETPGVAWRSRAISAVTLKPGSWPPSPGLAPCAILISSSRQLLRYSAVTPKRPEAVGILAALARIRLGADPVHRDVQGAVRLGRQRAQGHAGGDEALADLGDR